VSERRLYTVEEASALLPSLVPVLQRIQAAVGQLRLLRAAIDADRRGATGDGALDASPWDTTDNRDRLRALERALSEGIAAMEGWDIEIKDPDRGLIDFHHERDGEEVYLCYLLGEESIGYWHRLDAGFAGRQPL
jgi:hypothetical protein